MVPPTREASQADDQAGQDPHRRGEALEPVVAREAEPPRDQQGDDEHAPSTITDA